MKMKFIKTLKKHGHVFQPLRNINNKVRKDFEEICKCRSTLKKYEHEVHEDLDEI